jgi:hypothetical protein
VLSVVIYACGVAALLVTTRQLPPLVAAEPTE